MKIYNYHFATGLLLGDSFADPDPLEEGNWLIPANATTVEPPAPQAGKTIHFVDGAWTYIDTPQQDSVSEPVEPTYAQKRAMEYPPITDYLDGVVKGDQAQIDKYIADCLAVKAKYPKGGE